jgi:hypothetical protein
MKTTFLFRKFQMLKPIIGLTICILLLSGCDNFLETDGPSGQILESTVFENDITATAAITTMYAKLRDEVLVTGNTYGLGLQMGLYSDELNYYGAPNQSLETFFTHQILASNTLVSRTWNSAYNLIYMANANLEGLEASQSLSPNLKNQLIGEALFIRALTHVYLVTIFSDIPYIKTTDYLINSQVSRMSEELVYENVINDLLEAKYLLNENYNGNERIRANKYVVSALLARVYLYTSQWELAETESSIVINHTGLYNLEMNLENEFLKTSTSAILQLKTKVANQATTEAITYIFTSGPPPLVALNQNLVNDFELNDLRRLHWVGEVTNSNGTWYFANKYRQGTNLQYSTIFRLAELYLIRAEARARANDISGAQEDLNTIRQRAGLPISEASTSESLVNAILMERQSELFTEHGHRWFDLKRLGLADNILSPIKPNWQATNIVLPIPETELLMNTNLNPQNPGY